MARSVCSPFPIQGISHEKNVPALPKASCPPIRLSRPHGHEERPSDHQSPPGSRPETSRGRRHDSQVRPSYAGLGFLGRRPPGDGSIWVARTTCCPGGHRPQEAFSHLQTAHASSQEADPRQSETLPRSRIIRRRVVFDATRNQGRRVSNRFMALNFLRHDAVKSGETGTVAFLTPKRVGAATKRTQLRRRMREIYRRHLARPDETAYLVWVARPPALELPFEELKKCMAALRERIKT